MKIAKLLAAGLALLFGAGIASAGTLDDIAKRGELRVAVQTQGPPFSMVDQAGARRTARLPAPACLHGIQ